MARRLSLGIAAAAAVAFAALTTACAPSDAGITTQVKAKIEADRNLTSKQMQVDTKKGVVTLSGTAASDAERKRAEELARTTDGVKDVVDTMAINPLLAPAATDAAGNAAPPSPAPPTTDTTPPAQIGVTPAAGR